jgi:hypothetical protein
MTSRNKRTTIALLVIQITVPKGWDAASTEKVKARVKQNLKKLEQDAMDQKIMAWPKGTQVEPVQGVFVRPKPD